jgi:hypothetical protein
MRRSWSPAQGMVPATRLLLYALWAGQGLKAQWMGRRKGVYLMPLRLRSSC